MDENELNELNEELKKTDEVLKEAKEFLKEDAYYGDTLKFHERKEVFESNGFQKIDGFTPGNQYKITGETLKPYNNTAFGQVMYETVDNYGKNRQIPHYYFNPVYKECKSIKDLEVPGMMVFVQEEHERAKEKNQLTSSGIPDIVWNLHEKLKEAEEWKQLAGVKQRARLSLVAIDNMQSKVSKLVKLAEGIADELQSMRWELTKKKEN